MVIRRHRNGQVDRSVDTTNRNCSNSNLCNIPKHPSTYTEATLKRTIDHFYLSKGHSYRAPGLTEYLPIGRPGEVAIYQDSLKAGLRFHLHPFLVEFFCTFNLSPDQLVPNALRMLNYYLLICLRCGIEPSVDVFRLLFEMKLLDRYDCYVVFSHRNRGLPSHDHFKIPNCHSSNSDWKNRYFFVKPVEGIFPFLLNWSVPLLEEFNSTPILTEPKIDTLITLRVTGPLGRSMNDALMDDALVSTGIGRPYEDFLEELARKNFRGQRKRRRESRLVDSPPSEAAPSSGQQAAALPVESQVSQTVTVQTRTPESSRSRSPRVASET
ncbi:Uncharacterized protein Adt_05462 [Abeliophyllum distichum]|uniref:Transposase (putative) gypsy type domain-containing protein n=1 Tax=Abeliophyllum distichum TaxID=126358 RepID=A0ABD1V450_9LAMI